MLSGAFQAEYRRAVEREERQTAEKFRRIKEEQKRKRDEAEQKRKAKNNNDLKKKDDDPSSDNDSGDDWDKKIREYARLPDEELRERERRQKSKTLRAGVATATTPLVAAGTGFATTAYHAGVGAVQGVVHEESKKEEQLLAMERESRGLPEKKRTLANKVGDILTGVAIGGFGPGEAAGWLDKKFGG